MNDKNKRAPDWLLERAALGVLRPDEREKLDAWREKDPTIDARLEALARENQEILQKYPAPGVAREVERRARLAGSRAGTAARPRAVWLAWAPALAVTSVVGAVLWINGSGESVGVERGVENGIRLKGTPPQGRGAAHDAPAIIVRRQSGQGAERLLDGQNAAAGQKLQLSYDSGGRDYAVLLSFDGRGQVTLHFPESAGAATRVAKMGEVVLPFAYVLDDAPRFERFFLLTAARPIDVEKALAAARALAQSGAGAERATLALEPDVAQATLRLGKIDPAAKDPRQPVPGQ